MKKKLFLFVVVLFSAINSFGQFYNTIDEIDSSIEYDCSFARPNDFDEIALCKEGGIAPSGEILYSDIFVNHNKYTSDEGFGFLKMQINDIYLSRIYDHICIRPTKVTNYYGLIHSANQNLILVRLKEGNTIKVFDFGLYKSILSVFFKNENAYGYNHCYIIATDLDDRTVNIQFSPNSELDKLEEIVVNVDVSSVTLNQSSITIAKGATAQLEATVLPEIATNKELEWTTSDANVATVADGLVTGVNTGMAIISAKATDGSNAMAQCIVVVQDASGISAPKTINNVEGVYTIDGKKVTTFSKGIYVVRMNDGATKTISIK